MPSTKPSSTKTAGLALELNVEYKFTINKNGEITLVTLTPGSKHVSNALKSTELPEGDKAHTFRVEPLSTLAKVFPVNKEEDKVLLRSYAKDNFKLLGNDSYEFSDQEIEDYLKHLSEEEKTLCVHKAHMRLSIEAIWEALYSADAKCSLTFLHQDKINKASQNKPLTLALVARFVNLMKDPKIVEGDALKEVQDNEFLQMLVKCLEPSLMMGKQLYLLWGQDWGKDETTILNHCCLCAGRMEGRDGSFAFLPPMFVFNMDVSSSSDAEDRVVIPLFLQMQSLDGIHMTFVSNPSEQMNLADLIRTIGKRGDKAVELSRSVDSKVLEVYESFLVGFSKVIFDVDCVRRAGEVVVPGAVPQYNNAPCSITSKSYGGLVNAWSLENPKKAMFASSWSSLAARPKVPKDEGAGSSSGGSGAGGKRSKKSGGKNEQRAALEAEEAEEEEVVEKKRKRKTGVTESGRCKASLKAINDHNKVEVMKKKITEKEAKVMAWYETREARIQKNLENFQGSVKAQLDTEVKKAIGKKQAKKLLLESMDAFDTALRARNDLELEVLPKRLHNARLQKALHAEALVEYKKARKQWKKLSKEERNRVAEPVLESPSASDHADFQEVPYIPKSEEIYWEHFDMFLANLAKAKFVAEQTKKGVTDEDKIANEAEEAYQKTLRRMNEISQEKIQKSLDRDIERRMKQEAKKAFKRETKKASGGLSALLAAHVAKESEKFDADKKKQAMAIEMAARAERDEEDRAAGRPLVLRDDGAGAVDYQTSHAGDGGFFAPDNTSVNSRNLDTDQRMLNEMDDEQLGEFIAEARRQGTPNSPGAAGGAEDGAAGGAEDGAAAGAAGGDGMDYETQPYYHGHILGSPWNQPEPSQEGQGMNFDSPSNGPLVQGLRWGAPASPAGAAGGPAPPPYQRGVTPPEEIEAQRQARLAGYAGALAGGV